MLFNSFQLTGAAQDSLRTQAGLELVLSSISALRSHLKTGSPFIRTLGYYTQGDGGDALYAYDSSDTTSTDNGGTVIVGSDGGRWKLMHTGAVSARQFGAKGNNSTDDTSALQVMLNCGASTFFIPEGNFVFSTLTLPSITGFTLYGIGPNSRLVQTGAGLKFPTLSSNCFDSKATIKDLGFDGTSGTGNTLDTTYSQTLDILNTEFNNTPVSYSSLYLDGNPTSGTYMHDVRVKNIRIYSTTAGNAGITLGQWCSDSAIDGFIMNGFFAVNYCLLALSNAQTTVMSNSHPYNAKVNVVKLSGNNGDFGWDNVTFDNAKQDIFYQTTSINGRFTNCFFEETPSGYSSVVLDNSYNNTFAITSFSAPSGSAVACVREVNGSSGNRLYGGEISTSSNWTGFFSLTGTGSFAKGFQGFYQWDSPYDAVTLTNVSALRTHPKTSAIKIQTLGYYATNDGGAGTYLYDSTDTTSADNGGTIIVGTDGGRWKLQTEGGKINIKQFGAKVDNLTDDTAAINAALSAATGIVEIPNGITKVSGTLNINGSGITLRGQGEESSSIYSTVATGDIIAIGNGTNNPNDCYVKGLAISATVAKTSGAAIKISNAHACGIDHVRLDSNMYNGFDLEGGTAQFLYYISNFEINSGNVGILVGDTSPTANPVQDLFIRDGVISNCTLDGILLRHVSGYYFDCIDVVGNAYAFTTYPDTNKEVVGGLVNRLICDTSGNNGFNFVTNGGIVAECTFVNCWASSNGSTYNSTTVVSTPNTCNGIFFGPGSGIIDGITFSALRAPNNRGAGVYITGGAKNILFSDPQIFGSSTAGSALRSGFEVGANVSQWAINGGMIGQGGIFSGSANGQMQKYGISIASGTSNNYSIKNVQLLGNVSGPLNNLGTAATGGTRTISGCVGFVNSVRGVTVVPTGSSTATVSHGLNVTPSVQDIQLSSNTNLTLGGVTSIWPSAPGGTTFQVNLNATTSNDTYVTYDIKTAGAQG